MSQSFLQKKNAKATEEEEEQGDKDDAYGKQQDEELETEKENEGIENGGKLLRLWHFELKGKSKHFLVFLRRQLGI